MARMGNMMGLLQPILLKDPPVRGGYFILLDKSVIASELT